MGSGRGAGGKGRRVVPRRGDTTVCKFGQSGTPKTNNGLAISASSKSSMGTRDLTD
jgi:hypothetical protein